MTSLSLGMASLRQKLKISSEVVSCQQQKSEENSFEKKYRLLKKLGEGTNGAVFLAESLDNGDYFAVKMFRTMDQELIDNIEKTFQIQQMTNDSNLFVKTFDLFINTQSGIHYMVQEYSKFQTLSNYLNSDLTIKIQIKIISNLAKAVKFLHGKRICHRDIKPDNILVEPTSGEIKLIDFGVSKLFGRSIKQLLTPTGCPEYRAPEIHQKLGYTEMIDIWCLGIVAIRMLSTERQNDVQDLSMIPNLDLNYKSLILRMIEPDASKRITPNQIIEQIDAMKDGMNLTFDFSNLKQPQSEWKNKSLSASKKMNDGQVFWEKSSFNYTYSPKNITIKEEYDQETPQSSASKHLKSRIRAIKNVSTPQPIKLLRCIDVSFQSMSSLE